CFSSRRRHTRFSRDWSSDVCSSDLTGEKTGPVWRIRCVRDEMRSDPGYRCDMSLPAFPVVRLAKAATVLAMALYATLVAFGNVTDYGSNFAFVQHVMSMDTLFPDATIGWRAITGAPWHHAAYIAIIVAESLVALLAWVGGVRMLRALRQDA